MHAGLRTWAVSNVPDWVPGVLISEGGIYEYEGTPVVSPPHVTNWRAVIRMEFNAYPL